MRHLGMISALAILIAASGASAADAGKQMFDASGKAGALAVFRCTIETDFGSTPKEGLAVCITTQPKPIFITFALRSGVTPEMVKNLTLIPPNNDKPIKAELLGVDPETSIGFVAAAEPYDKWSVVQFAKKADLTVGQMVTSIGLLTNELTQPPYTGVGYVSTIIRTPQQLVYVAGGKLTGQGSPVFNEEGKAIGLVGYQRPLGYQISAGNQPSAVALIGQEETSFFTPVDEFAHVLTNIPASPDKVRRLPWIGILGMNGVTKEVAEVKKLDRPAVELTQVLPDQPAAKAGVKDGDIVLAINGEALETLPNPDLVARAMITRIIRMPVGQNIKLTLHRGDATLDIEVPLAATPAVPDEAKKILVQDLGFMAREKVALDQYLDKTSTATVPGLMVILVGNGTPAAGAGMLQNDLITTVNGQAVTTVPQIKKILEDSLKADINKPVVIVVRRGDQTQTLSVRAIPPTTAPAQP